MWFGPIVNGSAYEDTFVDDARTTYGGLYWAILNHLGSSMLLSFAGAVGHDISSSSELASAYATNITGRPDCNLIFQDQMDEMLAGAGELLFRAAIGAGLSNNSLIEQVVANETIRQNVYQSR